VITRLSRTAQVALLASVLQAALLSWLIIRQFSGLGSHNWDVGIFTQATFDLSHGDTFMSIRGMDILGHHFNLILYLLAPVAWLGGGARALSLIQVVALVSGAWPAYLLGRDRVAPESTAETRGKFGLLAAVLYLLHPAVTGLSWWMFHPETLGLAAILWAWWAVTNRRWSLYVASLIWILLCREDLALAMAGFGVVIMVVHRGRQQRRILAIGAATAVFCMGFWVVVTQVVMPARIGTDEPYYVKDFWGHLGNTMPEVLSTAARHPGRATQPLHGPAGVEFVASILGPTAGLNLMSPLMMIPALPQLAAITLSNDPDSRQSWHHHGALIMPFSVMSAIETLRWLRRRRPKLLIRYIPITLAISLLTYFAMSPNLLVRPDRWTGPTPESTALHAAIASIPRSASVAATVTPAVSIANRKAIYTWPNPWRKWKRGYEFEQLPDPNQVEYLLVLRSEISPRQRDLFERLISPGGGFEITSDTDGVLLARRRSRG
jgi:uncharacterized membrane protein